jgi:hypothetical protein
LSFDRGARAASTQMVTDENRSRAGLKDAVRKRREANSRERSCASHWKTNGSIVLLITDAIARFGKGEIWLWNFQIVTGRQPAYSALECRPAPREQSPSHQQQETPMLSALLETVGALGILASVAAKIAGLRKEYRRCKKVCGNKKTPPERGR